MERLTRKKAIKLAVNAERRRCIEIARKPSAMKRVPGGYDPYSYGSGYLQASDDIVARITDR